MDRDLVKLLQDLIKIDSQNPPGNEEEINLFIHRYLKNLGVTSKIYEFQPKRTNVVCRIKSKNSRKRILLTPHVDTVPATGRWKFAPFSGTLYKGKVYGRGATDCKANVAVALYVIKKLKQENIRLNNLDLVFAFTGDEETGSRYGIKPLIKYLKGIDYALVLDANEFDIIVAQKGLLHLRVELFGKEAHGAYPERGINAIEKAIDILSAVRKNKMFCRKHRLLKHPTLNIGRLEGGEKVNIVAGQAFFELDIRYLPFMGKDKIIAEIERLIKKHNIRYKIKVMAHQAPIEINTGTLLIKTLKKVLKVNKITPVLKPSFGATVINFLKDKGIETFAFGFGSRKCAHTRNEYVKVKNLTKGVKVLKEFLEELDAYF
jgi:succinyl-diaminopimelate desuccinylase